MEPFRFAPELFEVRNDVLAKLSDAGYEWLSHFSAVDPLHDLAVAHVEAGDDALREHVEKLGALAKLSTTEDTEDAEKTGSTSLYTWV